MHILFCTASEIAGSLPSQLNQAWRRLTGSPAPPIQRRSPLGADMRIRNSLKAAKTRDKNCRVVRRRGRVYVINKKNPRMKARQG